MTDSTGERRPEAVEIDTSVAHVARVYDFLLGGTTNFAVDRAAAEEVTAAAGGVETSRRYVRANRRFLGRAVRHLVSEAGGRQFLDLGSGIPTERNVHEVAHQAAPDAKVVYVDNDPIVLALAHELLEDVPEGTTSYIDADLRDSEHILRQAAGTLDLTQPVAVMLVSMLHLFPDDADASGIVASYLDAVVPGSFLVLSHLASESEEMTKLGEAIEDNETTNYTLTMRSHPQVARFLDGLEPIEPGLVLVDDWRPEPGEPAGNTPFHGAVARKP